MNVIIILWEIQLELIITITNFLKLIRFKNLTTKNKRIIFPSLSVIPISIVTLTLTLKIIIALTPLIIYLKLKINNNLLKIKKVNKILLKSKNLQNSKNLKIRKKIQKVKKPHKKNNRHHKPLPICLLISSSMMSPKLIKNRSKKKYLNLKKHFLYKNKRKF